MRTHLLLLPAALAATQVYLFPAPEGAHAPTLSAEQASAVMSHHLGGDISAHDTPKDEGMWAHLLNLWDNGEKRPRVVILEGGDAQGESSLGEGAGESAGTRVLPLCSPLSTSYALAVDYS